jgi:uncharacterized protein DUF2330
MNRSAAALGISVATSALAFVGVHDATACGGCFHPPTQTVTDITDERMLLAVSPMQSTLYDQIEYSGSPASFAWVLPIHGTVTVGLSADVLFDSIDAVTATQITAPAQNCPIPAGCAFPVFSAPASATAGNGAAEGTVTVLKQQNVGPYATVQLQATDSSALNNWLMENGFNIPAAVLPVINAYISEGFDFLAMKLLPGEGVQAMRPVRVTTAGSSLSLPLRMASIGTGAQVGITIWVVSDGRYEPQNFPFFHIDDSQLVWDWSTDSSNYTTLRAADEAALNYTGWEIESSLELNEQIITGVILSGGQYYGNTLGGGGLAAPPPSDPSIDYLPVGDPDAGTDGGADSGDFESAEEVRTEDINALFAGLTGPSVRVTRMRSDIAHAAMTADFVLQASADQSELSNIRYVTQSVNLQCPIYSPSCNVVGTGTPAEAAASGPDGAVPSSVQSGTGVDASVAASGGSADASSPIAQSDATVDASVPANSSAGANGLGGGSRVAPASAPAASGGGCAAAAQGAGGSPAGVGFLAGLMGLVAARVVRRRSSKKA